MSLAIALGLNKAGHVSLEQIEEAMNAHILYGGSLLSKLVELGYLNDVNLAEYLAREYSLPLATAQDFASINASTVTTMNIELATELKAFPLKVVDGHLYVAMFNPTEQESIDKLASVSGFKIIPMVATDSQIQEAIQYYYVNDNIKDQVQKEDIANGLEENWQQQVTEDMNELSFADCASPEDDFSDDDDDEAFSAPPPEAAESFTYASFEFAEDEGESFSINSALRLATQSLGHELRATHHTRVKTINQEIVPTGEMTIFQKLAMATSRDEIAALSIEHAKQIWPRILLLVERQNFLKVWASGGTELAGRKDLATMKIPLHQTSQFRKCCYHAQPFLGTLSLTSRLYDSFYNRLGGPLRPQRTVMIPIFVGKKVIGVFYADSGSGNPVSGDISELYSLIDAIGSGFENLISKRHHQLSSQG